MLAKPPGVEMSLDAARRSACATRGGNARFVVVYVHRILKMWLIVMTDWIAARGLIGMTKMPIRIWSGIALLRKKRRASFSMTRWSFATRRGITLWGKRIDAACYLSLSRSAGT
jgi:hypothetical protein